MATGDYSDYTVEELREELRERDLSTTGNKAELIERLEYDDADDGSEPAGVTANAVRELSDEAKTGAIRRREAREERLAGEAELYERQQSGEKGE